eukprot:CAMPEP_0197196326 /NCGR_PEP_ID=MMETSP1423-20130617/32297_1 /TAXON_ID=476441 /ORGANISM="Pseudo-nitzschia heimii, Strain UNC1101" /LENGTH=626 /DNA_ID=CAMNT_0042650119 /DNA_START=12 /DNA_END=1892 /DNA_ORIENTATION=-
MKFVSAALALAMIAPANAGDPCDGEQLPDIVTNLDLYESNVVTNTLHLDGGELRYDNVGTFQNQRLDLRVTITGGDYTDIEQVWIDRKKGPSKIGDPDELNGKKSDSMFGNINLQTVKDKPKSGEGQFRFCWVLEGTDEPVEVEAFSWTIYDADERGSNNGIGIKEKMLMDVSQASYYQLDGNTEIITSCEDGSTPPCASGDTVFTSSTSGTGPDNPTDPNSLTAEQRRRSIAFTFRNTSCWDFIYDHYCPADQTDWEGSQGDCAYYTGGNFLFSGGSDDIIETGECITQAPVPAPPTEAPVEPTEAPVEPTEAPVEPTEAPVEPTEAPVEPTEAPVEPTEAPIEPTEAPVEPTEAPVEPTEAPVEPTEAPVEPTEAPVEPTEAPVEPTEAPVEPTEAPVEPTEAPVEPTEAPVEPTEAPVEPTEAPVEPTEAPVEPTQAPVEETKAPVSSDSASEDSPTEAPDTPNCPEDVILLNIDGVTEIPVDGAVSIISQDTTSVTVALNNAWTSEQDAIDNIFYQYRVNAFDDQCFEEQDVNGGDNYAEITISCLQTEPYARLDICVADNDGALQTGDDAKVPKCCEPELEPETPVVCYNLAVWCETQCVDTAEATTARRSLRGAAFVTKL